MLEKKEKKKHGEGGRKNTIRRTGMSMKKWKDLNQKEDG
jgi:hypothetical protein